MPPKTNIKTKVRGLMRLFAGLKLMPTAGTHIKFQEIDLKLINKALALTIAFFAVFVIWYAVKERPSVAKIVNTISSMQLQPIIKKETETLKTLALYQQEIQKRDIFKPMSKIDKKVVSAQEEKRPLEKLTEMAKDISLKGIAWNDSPKVIIRSEKEDKVYFLKEGQTIGSTGIELKAITKDKVIISYEETEMELQ